MSLRPVVAPPRVPLDEGFYRHLGERRGDIELVSSHVIPGGTGYGARVEAGQTFRFVVVDGPAGLDIGVQGVEGPSEWFSLATQLTIEGVLIPPGTRVWSVPPRTRPLCTVVRDTYWEREGRGMNSLMLACGGHCNPHEWVEFHGRHPRTCEDNLRAAAAMLGLSQREIGENINAGWQFWLDPETGYVSYLRPPIVPGDFLELYAEVPLHVMVSLCPSGSGDPEESHVPEGDLFPIRFEIYDTGISPLPWPS